MKRLLILTIFYCLLSIAPAYGQGSAIPHPMGADTYYQYNNGWVFGGSAHAYLNDVTGMSTFTGATIPDCAVLGSNSAVFKPGTDATDFFQINNTAGASVFNANTTNRQVTIGYTSETYPFLISSTDGSDQIQIYHDNSNAYIKWTEGHLRLQTDKGDNTTTYIQVQGKGTGYGLIQVYDQDDAEYWQIYSCGGVGYMDIRGTNPLFLALQSTADVGVKVFHSAVEGETQAFSIYGYGTGSGGKESLDISVEQYAANVADFMGLEAYMFGGNLVTWRDTHENSDGGRETSWSAKGEKTDGTIHTLGAIEFGHDGTGDDYHGYVKLGTNATDDTPDTIIYPFKIDSSQITHIGDGTNEVQITGEGVQTYLGNARFWQGVVLDTSRFKEPTSNSATLVNRGIGTAYKFTKDQEAEHLHAQISIPGFWDVSEDIQVILFWDTPVTSDDCDWEIHYQFRSYDEAMDSVTYDGVANSSGATSSATSKGLVHSTVVIPTAAFDTGDKMLRLGIYRDGVTDSIDDFVYLHGMRVRGVRNKTGGAM